MSGKDHSVIEMQPLMQNNEELDPGPDNVHNDPFEGQPGDLFPFGVDLAESLASDDVCECD